MTLGFRLGKTRLEFLRRVPVALSTAFIAVFTTIAGIFSVLAGPSYPSALLFGLIVPSVTAVSTSLIEASGCSPEEHFLRALKRAVSHSLAVLVPLSLHALRVGWCSPLHDLILFFLGPVFGIILAATWGTTVALTFRCFSQSPRHQRLLILAALACPIGRIIAGLIGFYRTPAVFAFDPFVGFFAGSPYDTEFDPTFRLTTYRVGSLGTLIAYAAALRHLSFTATNRPQIKKPLDRLVFSFGILGLGLSIAMTANGISLGHHSTEESIRSTLGFTLQVGRCEVVYGVHNRNVEIERIAKDCDAWLGRLERRLGTAKLDKVTAFVFDGTDQKERLMGAAHTQIAKPWRQEIYLNASSYPDDVVGHELAHVVAGQIAPGPFTVAGNLFGLLPNPGLIEGLAVALAPDEDGDLTPAGWSRTLQELERLPPLESLFSLGFFAHSSTMAYTVAGAFVDYIGKNYGKSTIRAWYRGQSLEKITGKTWPELEGGFQTYLRKIDVPKDALNAARARFARPGLFTRRCPHAVDRAIETAERQLYQGDAKSACRFYEHALELDPTEISARFGLGECSRRDQDSERAELAFRKIISDLSLPQTTRERAEEQLADLFFEQEKPDQSRVIYEKLIPLTLETDRRRTLEIKASALTPRARTAIKSLLIGKNGEKTWDIAVRDLLLWSQSEPQNGLPDYLLARNFWNQGREAVAVEHLDRALGKSIELADVLAEAYRLRATMACAQNDAPTATKLAERLAQNQSLTEPRRLGILRLIERCAGRRVGDDWPETREPAKVLGPVPSDGSTPIGTVHSSSSNSLPWNTTQFDCPHGMAKIPGETFWMGSKRGYNADDETPRFQTQIRGFCLDETEVTVETYRECVKEGKCTDAQSDSSTCNYTHNDRLKHPINCVNYAQAEAYCHYRSARLPTESEWEFAARGGAQALKYPWGEGSPDGRACWKNHMTCPVKTFAAGAYGLFDMTGNVWEWTSSEYSPYPFPGLSDENRKMVYRGGSWSRRFEKWMHVGLRNRWGLHEQGSHLGLRCAISAKGVSCPMGADESGICYPVILAAECPPLQTWNGFRCAPPNAPECEEGLHADRMHGCIRDIPLVFHDHLLDTQAVKHQRSPEFDADCRENQPKRPVSYRYFGGEHEARNLVSRQAGCKNRDVGAGWNSTCCP